MREPELKVSQVITAARSEYTKLKKDLQNIKYSLRCYDSEQFYDINKINAVVHGPGNITFYMTDKNNKLYYLGKIVNRDFFDEGYYKTDDVYMINDNLALGINPVANYFIAVNLNNIANNLMIKYPIDYQCQSEEKLFSFNMNSCGIFTSSFDNSFLSSSVDYDPNSDQINSMSSFKENHSVLIEESLSKRIPIDYLPFELLELVYSKGAYCTEVVPNNYETKSDVYIINDNGSRVLRKE